MSDPFHIQVRDPVCKAAKWVFVYNIKYPW